MTLIHRAKTWADPDSAVHTTTDAVQDTGKLVELQEDVLKTLKAKKASDEDDSEESEVSLVVLHDCELCLLAN